MPTGLGDELVWYCPTFGVDVAYEDQTGQGAYLTGENVQIAADNADGGWFRYDFTGSGSSYLGSGYPLVPTTVYSVSAWVKGSASGSEVAGVINQSNINNQRGFLFGSYQNSSQGGDGSKLTHFYQSNPSSYNGSQKLQSYATVFDNTWHHVVVTFQGGSRTNIFVDGVLDRTTSSNVPSSIASTGVQFELGRYAGSNGFNGGIDDVRVFNRVITDAEVAHLATGRGVEGQPTPPPAPPAGLGDEKLWIAPTYTDNISNIALETGTGSGTTSGPVAVVEDPDGTGNCLQFNNTSTQSYKISWASGTNQTYTVSTWYRVPNQYGTLFNYNSSVEYLLLFLNTNSLGYPLAWNDSNQPAVGEFSYDETWHHFAYQRSGYGAGGVSKFYSDGVLVHDGTPDGSQNGSWTGSTLDIGVMSGSGNQSRNLQGYLDDFRFYDHLISDTEIAWLATARNVQGSPPLPAGLGDEKLWLCPSLNNSADDISGNGNNGTYQGGMGTVADTGSGGAYAYDHSTVSRSIQLPADLGISGNTISLAIWLENDVTATGGSVDQWLGAYNSVNSQSNPLLYQFGTNFQGADKNENPDTTIVTSFPATTSGTWRHVVIVADGSSDEYRLYENGSLKDTKSAGGSDMTIKTAINWYVGAGNGWVSALGKSDDIRAYDRTLTQAEITHLATSRGVLGPPDTGSHDPFNNPHFTSAKPRRIR